MVQGEGLRALLGWLSSGFGVQVWRFLKGSTKVLTWRVGGLSK